MKKHQLCMKTEEFRRFVLLFEPVFITTSDNIIIHDFLEQVGWAFDLFGNIWGVGRNEDGDASGWGSRTFRTFDGILSDWIWISGNKVRLYLRDQGYFSIMSDRN